MNIEINKKTVGAAVGIKAVILLAGAFLWAHPAMAQTAATDHSNMTTLDISAQVNVNVVPDMAEIGAGVINTAKTAQEALKANAGKMTSVFAALKEAGIAEKDIQTTGVNISAQFVYEPNKAPRVTGYQATNNVSVKLHDLKNIGKVMDTLVDQGANQLNGPTFSVEDPDKLLDEARVEAVNKAKKRADLYAGAAGLKVKRIITMSESSSESGPPRPYPMMMAKMAMGAAAPMSPVSTGQVGLNVTVSVTYELTP